MISVSTTQVASERMGVERSRGPMSRIESSDSRPNASAET